MNKNDIYFEVIRTIIALCIAFVITALVIFIMSDEPWYALSLFISGPLQSFRRFGNVLDLTVPLIFTGLGVSIIFQSNQFNISVSGVFVIGAVATAVSAIFVPMPPVIGIILFLLIGSVIGSFFTLIPGILKEFWSTSELVSSLMLNYILYEVASYVINNFARDVKAVAPVSLKFQENALLPELLPWFRVHSGLLIAVLILILTYFFLYKSKWGYAIRMTGLNNNFARYSGINTRKAVLLAQILGGAIIGLGGGVEMLGMYTRYQWQVIPSYGFDGIIVALIARNNPLYIAIAAFLLAYIRIGADIMSRNTDIPSEIVLVIQSVVIVIIMAERFLYGLRYKRVVKHMYANLEKEQI